MKRIIEFILVDVVIALIITFLLEAILHHNLSLSSLFIFLFVAIIAFNVHFFGWHLYHVRKLKLIKPLDKLIDSIQSKGHEQVKDRINRINKVINEAVMLVENPTPGPSEIIQINEIVCNSNKNFIAVSANSIYLWDDSTFLFYFMLSGLKNIQMKSVPGTNTKFKLSIAQADLDIFRTDERNLLNQLSRRRIPSRYFALRFLIYYQKNFDQMSQAIKTLISANHMFRIHCIPLTIEGIEKSISQVDKKEINILSQIVKAEGNYPDYLLTDTDGSSNVNGCLTYYENAIPQFDSDSSNINKGLDFISLLARLSLMEGVKWNGYELTATTNCGIGVVS